MSDHNCRDSEELDALREETMRFLDILLQDYIAVAPSAPISAEPILSFEGKKRRIRPVWEYPGYLEFIKDGIVFKIGTDYESAVLQYDFLADPGYTYSTDELLPAFTIPYQNMAALMRDRYKHRDSLLAYIAEGMFKVLELNATKA